jgi:hypothetical protein
MTPDEKNVPEVIQAQKFELLDGEGNVLALLSANVKGHGQLITFDDKGNKKIGLTTINEAGGIAIFNDENRLSIFIRNGQIEGYGKQYQVFNIGKNIQGDGNLNICNSKGQPMLNMTIEDGTGIINAYNSEGKYIKSKLKLGEFIDNIAPVTFFVVAIASAILAIWVPKMKYNSSLVYAFGMISASCFISSALLLRRKKEVKYDHLVRNAFDFDKEVTP